MRQQINLYSPDLLDQPDRFSAARLAIIFGLLALTLVLYGAWLHWRLYEQRTDNAALQRAVDQQQAELERYNAARKTQRDAMALLERQRAVGQAMLQQVTGQGSRSRDGFAETLAALGRQHPDDFWLRGLYLVNGGRELLLEGSTLRGERLPRYLRALADEPRLPRDLLFSTLPPVPAGTNQARLDFFVVTPCNDAQGQRLSTEACRARIRQAVQP
ncbi:MAG: hypothetical protein QG599_271 [Pseudomonadota bacterium]|nr:hypothetical protein [Pseudomonadota bacterium]